MGDGEEKTKIVGRIAEKLVSRSWFLGTAESCTGGLIAHSLTDVPGSSEWFKGGIVAYANSVKESLLKVPGAVLDKHGAVSEETVLAMAEGVCKTLGTEAGLSVSGIAGPSGGSADKPVGLVWMAWAVSGQVDAKCFHFSGTRADIKAQAAFAALQGLAERL
ncbi:MAG: CinA family protein [Thermodesulfobacteriota bacterium]|nr:CinA family protein [Thermodesulfobacteriota bacterium]